MKKLVGIIAGLKMGMSSIVMGCALEVVSGGGFLVGLDRLSQQEIRLVREGEFRFDPVSGRFENDDVSLLSWQPDIATSKEFSLDRMLRQICLPTTEIEFVGNLSSGSATPVGGSFTKTQRIFDSKGEPHNLIFTFTRLPAGMNADNQVQYQTEITVDGGVIKRMDAGGTVLDSSGAPMIVTFNQRGQLNLFDYGQLTESNTPSKLYVEWNDLDTADPLNIDLKWGKGKGWNPTLWSGEATPFAIGNLSAYDGNSLIAYNQQDGGYEISRLLTAKEPLRFSWIEKATGLATNLSKIDQSSVRKTSEIEFSGNLSSGAATPVGGTFTKTQRIFDSLGTPHNLIFAFKRLPAGVDSDNQIQYSIEVTLVCGIVRRSDASGGVIDSTGTPMIITFNQNGLLNLFDYGQPTEANIPPKLYIEWTEGWINSEPFSIALNLGKGKGASPTAWGGPPEILAEGNLAAYDGNSLITYSKQDGLGYGRYERVTASEVGKISAHYSNGKSLDIGRLAFAIVPNPAGLRAMGMSYRITESSGLPTIAMQGQAGWGRLKVTDPVLAKVDHSKEGKSIDDAAEQPDVVPQWWTKKWGSEGDN